MNASTRETPSRSRLRRLLTNRWLLAVLAAGILYTLAGFFLIPRVLESRAASWATETLGCRLELERIQINPYALTLDMKGCTLREPDGSPILSFQRFFANFQLSSLVHRAWTFAEFRLEGPYLHVDVPPEGPPNLVRLMEKAAGPPEDSSPDDEVASPGLVFEHIRITDGRVLLSDRTGSTPAEADIHPIHLDIRDLSTRTEQKAPHTLEASLPGGGALTWSGKASLTPMASQGSIELKGLRPDVAWPFFRDHLHVRKPEGQIDVEASYRFGLTPRGPELVVDPFRIQASGLAVPLPEDEIPSLRLDNVSVGPGRFDLGAASLDLGSIHLERGRVALCVDEQGRLDWKNVTNGAFDTGPAESAKEVPSGASPFNVRIHALEAKEIGFRFVDRSRATPLAVEMESVTAGLSSARIEREEASIQAVLEDIRVDGMGGIIASPESEEPLLRIAETSLQGGRLDLAERTVNLENIRFAHGRAVLAVDEEGRFTGLGSKPDPKAAIPARPGDPSPSDMRPFRLEVGNLSLEDLGVRFVDRSRATPLAVAMETVTAGLSARVEWQESSLQVAAKDMHFLGTGGTLRSPPTHEPLLSVAETDLRGGRFDLAESLVGIEELRITGARADVVRKEDGTIQGAGLFEPGPQGTPSPGGPEAEGAGVVDEQPTWALDLASFHLGFPSIRLRDRKVGADPLYVLEDLRLDVRDVHMGSDEPFPFELSLETKPDGSARASGTVDLAKTRVEAELQAEAVDLRPLQPYLATFLRVDLVSGSLSARGHVQYERNEAKSPHLSGEASLSDILVTRPGSEERLLAFQDAQARGVTWSPRPNGLAIEEVTFTEPAVKLVIQEDKGLGIQDLLVSKGEKEAPPASESRDEDQVPLPVEIQQVRLENGRLDFADQRMRPRFSALVHELEGTIASLSSQPGRHASLALDGRVDEYGSTRIEGSIEIFDPTAFTEVAMRFHNVDMSHLSPYATRFAGYRIESGKLSLDLDYAIRDSRLQAKNRIVLDHLILGERMESPDALDLPLELAVALLQDKNGRIDIGLPLSGDLNNPEFSFGHLVRQALANFLKKIVTAPFRALGGLLGGRGEDLDAVGFEPGRAELPVSEMEELLRLSEALQKRPKLAVQVHGAYAPETDGAALRRAALRRDLAEQSGTAPAEGEAPPPLVYTDPSTQKALSTLASERLSPEAVKALREEHGAQREKSAVGPLAFYRALFERLVEVGPLQEDALEGLARLRANAVVRQLLTTGGLDHTRVTLAEEVSETDPENGRVPCHLEMKAAE